MEKVEGAYDVVILKQKINEIIGYLNSQAQPEENEPEKVYVEPIVPNFTEELSAPVEYKTRKQVKEMFKDTPEEKEEWEKRFIRRFGYWGEEIKFIKQLLDEREREVRKQERMIRLHKRVSKKIDNLEEPYKSFAKAGAGII